MHPDFSDPWEKQDVDQNNWKSFFCFQEHYFLVSPFSIPWKLNYTHVHGPWLITILFTLPSPPSIHNQVSSLWTINSCHVLTIFLHNCTFDWIDKIVFVGRLCKGRWVALRGNVERRGQKRSWHGCVLWQLQSSMIPSLSTSVCVGRTAIKDKILDHMNSGSLATEPLSLMSLSFTSYYYSQLVGHQKSSGCKHSIRVCLDTITPGGEVRVILPCHSS